MLFKEITNNRPFSMRHNPYPYLRTIETQLWDGKKVNCINLLTGLLFFMADDVEVVPAKFKFKAKLDELIPFDTTA